MPIYKGNTLMSGGRVNLDLFTPNYAAGFNISSPYTCQSRGLVWCWKVASNQNSQLLINGVQVGIMWDKNDSGSCGGNAYAWVSPGDIVSISGPAVDILRFFPMKA